MTPFEFLVVIVAIPIGLALVDIAQGLSRLLRHRGRIKVGWFTPLLISIIMQILAFVWFEIFQNGARITLDVYEILLAMTLATAFYVSASLVLPPESSSCQDLDQWYRDHRHISLGMTTLIYIVVDLSLLSKRSFLDWEPDFFVFMIVLFLPFALALFAKRKRWIALGLILGNIPFSIAMIGQANT